MRKIVLALALMLSIAGGVRAQATTPLLKTGVGLSSDDTVWPLVPNQVCGKPFLLDYWAFLEPSKGKYNWFFPDAQVSLCSAHSTPIIFTFSNAVPKWAAKKGAECNDNYCAGPEENPSDLQTFVSAVASRYKGKYAIIELGNEPDSPDQFEEPNVVGSEQFLSDLVAQTHLMYTTYHAIDPSALFATPGYATNTSQVFENEAIAAYLSYEKANGGIVEQYVAFHWYPRIEPGGECTSATIMVCANNLANDIASVKTIAMGMPLLLTESSWNFDKEISIANQPLFATAWVNAVKSQKIVGIWWAWQKSGHATNLNGTLWNGYVLNSAGQAFKTAMTYTTYQASYSDGTLWNYVLNYSGQAPTTTIK